MPGWQNFPLAGGEEPSRYDDIIQFWHAARERDQSLGSELSPSGLHVWETGTISGTPVDNGDGSSTLTISGKSWHLAADGCKDPWLPSTTTCSTTNPSYAPTSWKCGIGNADPTQAVAGDITSWTASTLTVSVRLADYVTSGQVPNLAFFTGLKVYIFAAGRPFWHEQWPAWPNDGAYDAGTVASATTTSVHAAGLAFPVHQLNSGYELMVRDTTGKYLRLTITDNTLDTTVTPAQVVITFAATTHAPTGDFAIVPAGARYLLGHVGCQPFAWYMGEWNGRYSHRPDDVLDLAPFPQLSVTGIAEGFEPCSPDPPPPIAIFDDNRWTQVDNECDVANEPLNPNVTKSLRWLQAWAEAVCPSFLPQATPQGSSKLSAFNGFAPATFFEAIGCDTGTGTVSGGSATIDTSSFEYGDGLDVAWALKDADGGVIRGGTATLTAAGSYAIGGFGGGDAGKIVVASPGWNRFFEKAIRAFEDVTYWLPDADPDALLPNTFIVPPREPAVSETAGPGQWITVSASTHYLVSSVHGEQDESGLAYYAIAANDIARFTGMNWWDTTTRWAPTDGGDMPLEAFYEDRAYVGRRRDEVQGRIDASKTGTVDAANVTAKTLIDPEKDWFNIDFFGGVLKTFSGADAISGTSATLTSQAGSAFFTAPTQWMVGQTIEGQTGTDGGGNPIWKPRLVTAQTGTALTLHEAMPSASNWRIEVPDSILNRWKGQHVRWLKLTPVMADGTTGTVQKVKIAGNGRRALFFSSSVTLPSGVVKWRYEIIDPDFGTVWKKAAPTNGDPTEWTEVTGGADAVRRGVTVPADFHKNSRANWPDVLKGYGRMCPGDSPIEHMNQLYTAINKLKFRPLANDWTAHPNPTGAAVNNSIHWSTGTAFNPNGVDCSDPKHTIECDTGATFTAFGFGSDMETGAEAHPTATSVEGAAPQSFATVVVSDGGCEAFADTVASYGKIAGVPGYGLVTTPGITQWLHATLDGTANCSYAATCGGTPATPDTFTANVTGVTCNDWASVASYTVYTDGSAYSSLVGSLAHGEWPTSVIVCPTGNPCSPSNPTGTAPDGGASGGWETDANIAVATFSFTYA